MKGKNIAIAICIVIITGVGIHAALTSEEEAKGGCQYANSFTDASGQTWSATDIEVTSTGCLEAIKIAVARAEQSVGLGSAELPAGWSCNASSVCTKGESRVTFALSLE